MSTVLPLAHAGHVLADLLYVVPVLVVVAWIAIRAIIDRHRGVSADGAETPAPPPPRAGDPPG